MRIGKHYQVVVVGAGPVGSLLAAELGRWGVRTAVIEAAPTTTLEPKAGTIHARSIQLLTRRGYFRPPDPELSSRSTVFHYAGQPGLEISAPAGEGPAIAGIGQSQLESAWSSMLPDLGVDVVRPATSRTCLIVATASRSDTDVQEPTNPSRPTGLSVPTVRGVLCEGRPDSGSPRYPLPRPHYSDSLIWMTRRALPLVGYVPRAGGR